MARRADSRPLNAMRSPRIGGPALPNDSQEVLHENHSHCHRCFVSRCLSPAPAFTSWNLDSKTLIDTRDNFS
jgi:hypothetical protein